MCVFNIDTSIIESSRVGKQLYGYQDKSLLHLFFDTMACYLNMNTFEYQNKIHISQHEDRHIEHTLDTSDNLTPVSKTNEREKKNE
jgi:hypothetical protein